MEGSQHTFHDAVQEYIGPERGVVAKWILLAEVQTPEVEDQFVAQRTGSLGGGVPTRTDCVGLLTSALAGELADSVGARSGPED